MRVGPHAPGPTSWLQMPTCFSEGPAKSPPPTVLPANPTARGSAPHPRLLPGHTQDAAESPVLEGGQPAGTWVPCHPVNTTLAQLLEIKPRSKDGTCFSQDTQRKGHVARNRDQSKS